MCHATQCEWDTCHASASTRLLLLLLLVAGCKGVGLLRVNRHSTLTLSLACDAILRPPVPDRELVADLDGAVLCRSNPLMWDWCWPATRDVLHSPAHTAVQQKLIGWGLHIRRLQ